MMKDQTALLSLLNKPTVNKVSGFVELIEKIREEHVAGLSCQEISKLIIDSTSYIDFLKQRDGFEADERIDNISELLGAMADFEESSKDKSVSAFLESISLLGDADTEQGTEDGVKLMTLHSAKGLEFPVVFIQGVEYGLLPYVSYGDNDSSDIEEERRLLYVGMTRGMKNLYLSWARSRRIFGGIRARLVSEFLGEIEDKYIEEYSDEKIYFDTGYSEQTQRRHNYDTGIDYSYMEELNSSVGLKVRHSMYGEGIIRATEGKGEKAKVTVAFRNYGTKKLIWGYANLTVYERNA